MSEKNNFVDKKEATAKLITKEGNIVTVIGNDHIRDSFEDNCLQQISTIADAPGITETVLNPDGHSGYGCPVGSVFASPDYIYPNSVGPDVKCSMSFLQTNINSLILKDKVIRQLIVKALAERIPLGIGNGKPIKARPFDQKILKNAVIHGATKEVLESLDINPNWANYCEDANHGDPENLEKRLDYISSVAPVILEKMNQLGGVGGGNHFQEMNIVKIQKDQESVANSFGLINNHVGFLNHFGSRGFGYMLTSGGKNWAGQFKLLEEKFNKWHIPFPNNDKHNVYCPVDSTECNDYLNDMNLGANFATVNHLLVCQYVNEALQEVLGNSVETNLIYYIAHNIIRREVLDGNLTFIHRKGATRAYSAGHHELKDTPFYKTGHPILLPGNPIEGSTIMVGKPGSRKALNSVNHGAGRTMSRKKASDLIKQKDVNAHLEQADIVTNCTNYPVDESPKAYKNYSEVIKSVQQANLADLVAVLKPIINIKDNDADQENSV